MHLLLKLKKNIDEINILMKYFLKYFTVYIFFLLNNVTFSSIKIAALLCYYTDGIYIIKLETLYFYTFVILHCLKHIL